MPTSEHKKNLSTELNVADTNQPIGIFDSGLGGLTVARAIAEELPAQSILYFGDTARCPYGERDQAEVATFVTQIVRWFETRHIKMLVIACNTATAAGLAQAQQALDVPVIGVIASGARAVVQETHTRRVGVLATPGTIASGAYEQAIHNLDAGVTVFNAASPRSVRAVEEAIFSEHAFGRDWMSDEGYLDTPSTRNIAAEDLAPLLHHDIDAVILGCTHFPLLNPVYQQVLGPHVQIVSSAEETASEVKEHLARLHALSAAHADARYHFATTSPDVSGFCVAGEYIFGRKLKSAEHVSLEELTHA